MDLYIWVGFVGTIMIGNLLYHVILHFADNGEHTHSRKMLFYHNDYHIF